MGVGRKKASPRRNVHSKPHASCHPCRPLRLLDPHEETQTSNSPGARAKEVERAGISQVDGLEEEQGGQQRDQEKAVTELGRFEDVRDLLIQGDGKVGGEAGAQVAD